MNVFATKVGTVLYEHATVMVKNHISSLFQQNNQRFKDFSYSIPALMLGQSKQRITAETAKECIKLADLYHQMEEAQLAQGCKIHEHDPQAMMNITRRFPSTGQIAYYNHAIEKPKNAGALIILTEWNEYCLHDYQMLELMKNLVIIYGRNMMDKKLLLSFGFFHYGLGR